MAGIPFSISVSGISLVANTAKTVAQIVAASNVRAKITKVEVRVYQGASGSDPALVELARQSSDGTLTSGTLVKTSETDAETLQSSAKHTATGEPGATTVFLSERTSVTAGKAVFVQDRLFVKGGSTTGVRVTSPVTAKADVLIEGEE